MSRADDDAAHMRAALSLAARNLGRTWPNPSVGCVLVRAGRVVGRGWTAPGGRPHAEAAALERAGASARGATAYVTLEPCAHRGRAGPCADALIEAGVARVVAALQDPDPRTAGRGFARLRAAGIEVETGVEAAAAARLNAGFLLRFSKRPRPFVTLKLAGSLDGRIATAAGDSRWITGTAARTRGHVLRTTHDAVMVGIGTVLADDPELTCRLPGLAETRPLPIVLDRNLRMPLSARLARAPALVFAGAAADPARRAALRERGVEVVEAAERDGTLDLADCLGIAAARGVTRILCEGGGRVAASLIAAGLADEILRFTGGLAIGGDGIPAIGALGLAALSAAPRFRLVGTETCGGDVAELWARDHVNESQPI
jgi:diaminohydroxyphosphoribosylaminopyrimidine deaminase/5-amino-6-(5-phosphoribosylamino)uracil reductase